MKKSLIIMGVLALAIMAYIFMDDSSPETTPDGTGNDSFGSSLKKTITGILPGKKSDEPNLDRHEESPHVVVINSSPTQIEVEDAMERIENLKDNKDHDGLDFARWTLLSENAKYTPDEKERLYDKAVEVLPMAEVAMLSRDILFVGNTPELNEKALIFLTKDMGKDDFKALITEILTRRKEPEVRAGVIEFAASKNVYVR